VPNYPTTNNYKKKISKIEVNKMEDNDSDCCAKSTKEEKEDNESKSSCC
jgi:hypothetical protein